MQNQLVNLAKFYNPLSANLIKSILEEENIFSSLTGEHASNVLPNIGNIIHLRVFENDLPKALLILKSYEKKVDFELLSNLV